MKKILFIISILLLSSKVYACLDCEGHTGEEDFPAAITVASMTVYGTVTSSTGYIGGMSTFTSVVVNGVNVIDKISEVVVGTTTLKNRLNNLDISTGVLQTNIDTLYGNVTATHTALTTAINSTYTYSKIAIDDLIVFRSTATLLIDGISLSTRSISEGNTTSYITINNSTQTKSGSINLGGYLTVSGNVGIGSLVPVTKLDVDGGEIRTATFTLTGSSFNFSNRSYLLPISPPISGEVMTYDNDGRIIWKTPSTSLSGGVQSWYLYEKLNPEGANKYETMLTTPSTGAEEVESVTINEASGFTLISSHCISNNQMGNPTSIPSGEGLVSYWAKVDNSGGLTYLYFKYSTSALDGVTGKYTWLITTGSEINSTSYANFTERGILISPVPLTPTTLVILEIYAKTDSSPQTRTVSIAYEGATKASFVRSTILGSQTSLDSLNSRLTNVETNISTGFHSGGSTFTTVNTNWILFGDGTKMQTASAGGGGGSGSVNVFDTTGFKVVATTITFGSGLLVTNSGSSATITSLSTQSYVVLSATTSVEYAGNFGTNFSTITGVVIPAKSIANSWDGRYTFIGGVGKGIYYSNNYSGSYATSTAQSGNWQGIDCSTDGKYVLAQLESNFAVVSNDYGLTFSTWNIGVLANYQGNPAVSYDGSIMLVAPYGQKLHRSNDYGVTFAPIAGTVAGNWVGVAMSSSGKYMMAITENAPLKQSSDYGVTWTTHATESPNTGCSMSGDGKYRVVHKDGTNVTVSNDYGVTYTAVSPALIYTANNYLSLRVSHSGKYMIYFHNGGMHISSDYGVTWTRTVLADAQRACLSRDASMIVSATYNSPFIKVGINAIDYIGGGAVGIGTNYPSSKFDLVDGSITIRGVMSGISIRDSSNNTDFTVLNNGKVGIGMDNPSYILHVNGEPASVGYTAWTNASDERLKQNEILVTESALTKIKQLKPIEYEYNDKFYSEIGIQKPKVSRKIMGFNAQDVQKVYPEWVSLKPLKVPYISTQVATSYEVTISSTGEKKIIIEQPKIEPELTNYYSLNTSNLQICLTKAIQELSESYDKLKSAFCTQNPTNAICLSEKE